MSKNSDKEKIDGLFDIMEKRKIMEIKVNDDDKYPEITSSIKEFMIRNKLDHV